MTKAHRQLELLVSDNRHDIVELRQRLDWLELRLNRLTDGHPSPDGPSDSPIVGFRVAPHHYFPRTGSQRLTTAWEHARSRARQERPALPVFAVTTDGSEWPVALLQTSTGDTFVRADAVPTVVR